MAKLLRLEAKDFLSYPTLDLDVADIGQLAIVGENGSGKSAILDAILWCVYGGGRELADAMTRDGTLGCWVKTTWLRGEQEVVITRSRSLETSAGESSLSLYVDGERRSGHTIADTQKAIVATMGMPLDAMLAGPIMVQGESGAFLRAKPAERKDLLISLFGLERWERYHDEAKTQMAVADRRATDATKRLEAIDEGLVDGEEEQLETEITQYKSYVQDKLRRAEFLRGENDRLVAEGSALKERARQLIETRQLVTTTSGRRDALANDMRVRQGSLQIALSMLNEVEPAITTVVPDDASILPLQGALPKLREREQEASHAVSRLQMLTQTEARLKPQAVATDPCEGNPPSCRFILAAQVAAAELEEIRAEQALQEPIASRYPAIHAEVIRTQEQVDAFGAMVRQAMAQRNLEEREHDTWVRRQETAVANVDRIRSELAAAEASHAAEDLELERLIAKRDELAADEGKMTAVADQLAEVVNEALEANGIIDNLRKGISVNEVMIDSIRKVRAEREQVATDLTAALAEVEELTVIVALFHRNGIPTLLLESALPEIEDKANDILARQPGGFSLSIITQQATKSASFKDTLDIVVSVNGRDRSYGLLSGGQKFRVDFAQRIALSSVIASQYGAEVDLLFLDEPLGPLDPQGQEAVAATLASVAGDFDLIAVVTHVPTFSELFDSRLSTRLVDDETVYELTA